MRDNAAPGAPKKRTTVTVDGEILKAAKAAGLNLSATLEQALAAALLERRRRDWRQENDAAVEEYNMQIRGRGAFGSDVRRY